MNPRMITEVDTIRRSRFIIESTSQYDLMVRQILREGAEYDLYLQLNEAPIGDVVNKIKTSIAKMPSAIASKVTQTVKRLPRTALPLAATILMSIAAQGANAQQADVQSQLNKLDSVAGLSSEQIQAQIAQTGADYDAAMDAEIDTLGTNMQKVGGMVNQFAKGVDGMVDTTATDTPPGPPPMVEPTFVPKDSQWFVDAKAKWLETNPSAVQVNKFNKTISYWNKEVAANGRSIRSKAVQETAKWLRDPNNAGSGVVNESLKLQTTRILSKRRD